MKRVIGFLFLAAAFTYAQTVHSVTLNWTDTGNPTGTKYNVYRAIAACSPTTTLVKVTGTPITVLTYVDTAVVGGSNYCYAITAVDSAGNESARSNMTAAYIPPDTPLPPQQPSNAAK